MDGAHFVLPSGEKETVEEFIARHAPLSPACTTELLAKRPDLMSQVRGNCRPRGSKALPRKSTGGPSAASLESTTSIRRPLSQSADAQMPLAIKSEPAAHASQTGPGVQFVTPRRPKPHIKTEKSTPKGTPPAWIGYPFPSNLAYGQSPSVLPKTGSGALKRETEDMDSLSTPMRKSAKQFVPANCDLAAVKEEPGEKITREYFVPFRFSFRCTYFW